MTLRVQALLLAAGSSRRFGSDKRFHQLDTGVPLVLQALRNLQAVLAQVVIVVKPGETARFAALTGSANSVKIVEAVHASAGMGASLASGIVHIDGDAVLVALADMPFIQTTTIGRVRDALQQHPLVVPAYHGQRGHPVGFQRKYFDELSALSTENGGKTILNRYPHDLTILAVKDPGIILDIDTPSHLKK